MAPKDLQLIALPIPDSVQEDWAKSLGWTVQWGTTFYWLSFKGEFRYGSGGNTPMAGTHYFDRAMDLIRDKQRK